MMPSRALVGSTKYVVVNHNVTSCSAVLNTDVNRVLHVCTGDGRTIVGGSVSIATGSTVSVATTVDEHGAAQVAGSTVTVTGGSTTLSGTCILGGMFSPAGGLVIASGSTISGVGTGASVVGAKLTNFKTISNLYIDGANKVTNGIVLFSTNTSITNSTIIYHSSLITGSAAVCVRSVPGASNVSITGCTLKNAGYIIMTTNNSSMSISNTLIDNCQYICVYNEATLTLSGCTVSNISERLLFISSGTSGTIVLKDYNLIQGPIGYEANFTGTKLYLISGSTLSCKATPKGNTSKFQAHTVSVGTFNGSEWVEGGTITFITKSGTTKHIWGTGTYIQMDGVTDLNSD